MLDFRVHGKNHFPAEAQAGTLSRNWTSATHTAWVRNPERRASGKVRETAAFVYEDEDAASSGRMIQRSPSQMIQSRVGEMEDQMKQVRGLFRKAESRHEQHCRKHDQPSNLLKTVASSFCRSGSPTGGLFRRHDNEQQRLIGIHFYLRVSGENARGTQTQLISMRTARVQRSYCLGKCLRFGAPSPNRCAKR